MNMSQDKIYEIGNKLSAKAAKVREVKYTTRTSNNAVSKRVRDFLSKVLMNKTR